MFHFTSLPPLGLYVHFPWCVRKCPYCDFNSHENTGGIPEQAYVDALLLDLQQELPRIWGRRVSSLYFGGGTPSLFSPAAIARLISGIRARLPCLPDLEITMETNPGTVDQDSLAGYRQAGVNRLSIGVQSFNGGKLKDLGRIHDETEAVDAVKAAQAAGFSNVNVDLMFGLPKQTPAEAQADLEAALALSPSHISLYQLTIEANTPFYRWPPELPDEDMICDIHQNLLHELKAAGYNQYEVSAFAGPGGQCIHNVNYWRFGDYLGIGAGAHGKITQHDSISRMWKQKHPKQYLAASGTPGRISGTTNLAPEDAIGEFMLNALRLTEGFPATLFQAHTSLPLSAISAPLELAERKGLISWNDTTILPTEKGQLFLNDLIQLFF